MSKKKLFKASKKRMTGGQAAAIIIVGSICMIGSAALGENDKNADIRASASSIVEPVSEPEEESSTDSLTTSELQDKLFIDADEPSAPEDSAPSGSSDGETSEPPAVSSTAEAELSPSAVSSTVQSAPAVDDEPDIDLPPVSRPYEPTAAIPDTQREEPPESVVSIPEVPEGQKIYVTKSGKRYHYDSTCNGGTYYEATLEEALRRNLTPCEKCVLH